MKDKDVRELYESVVGKPPARLPGSDPLAWQFEYVGRSEDDKAALAHVLGLDDRDLDVQIVPREQGKLL